MNVEKLQTPAVLSRMRPLQKKFKNGVGQGLPCGIYPSDNDE